MFFSIVIPLYNKSYSIVNCIQSVLSQTYQKFEVIVVNDGSTDNSLSIVSSSFSDEIARDIIKVIDQPNQGVSVARNNGAQAAQSNFICFLDADDKWKPDFLTNLKSLIDDYPDAVLFCLQHETQQGQHGKPIPNKCYFKSDFKGYVPNFYKASLVGSIANFSKSCIKKDSLKDVGYFPEGEVAGEDLYIIMELARVGKIAFYNKISTTMLVIEDNSRSKRVGEIPYPFKYYGENDHISLTFWAKAYLFRVYLAHLLSSIKDKDFKAAADRTKSASKSLTFLKPFTLLYKNSSSK